MILDLIVNTNEEKSVNSAVALADKYLVENGFDASEVAVVYPDDLASFVGPDTKVLGISSMDPTGMGYVSKTYSSIIGGGEPMNALEFKRLVKHPSIEKFKPKIIVGGFGSWQLERKNFTDKYNIDCVIMGGRPDPIVNVFKKLVNGEAVPRVVHADESLRNWDYGTMPLVKHAAIHIEVPQPDFWSLHANFELKR